MTRTALIAAYRRELVSRYGDDWAADVVKLDRMIASMTRTISSEAKTWNHSGPAINAAWRAIGGKGVPSLTAMRALI